MKIRCYDLEEMKNNGLYTMGDCICYEGGEFIWWNEHLSLLENTSKIISEDEYFFYVESGEYNITLPRELELIAYEIIK